MTPGRLFQDSEQAREWAAALPLGAFGRERFDYCATAASTQDLAFEAAPGEAPDRAVFVTEEQTAGRGRQGRKWLSPSGQSLLLSALLKPVPADIPRGMLSLGAALATCRALERGCSLSPAVKWPNDVLLNGRKVCGILVETRGPAAAIGIGLNVLQPRTAFTGELASTATSLLAETGTPPDRLALLGLLLEELGAVLRAGPQGWEPIARELAPRLAWRGRAVRAAGARGRLLGLEADGRLRLQPADGSVAVITSGSLELDNDGG